MLPEDDAVSEVHIHITLWSVTFQLGQKIVVLNRGPQTFPMKVQRVNILGFEGAMCSLPHILLWLSFQF